MDLRVKKTTKSIKEAFFELRKKKNLEKISVKELSEMAMINKATFYLHYRDIFDLSDRLENELIDNIISEVKNINPINSKANFKLFFQTLSMVILNRSYEIRVLFSGQENNHFVDNLEESLKAYLFSNYPSLRNNIDNNLLLTFTIQGSYRTFVRNSTIKSETLVEKTSEMTLGLFESYSF
jgi:AcrR family transcriptional regulator